MLPWTIDAKDLDIVSVKDFENTIFHYSNKTRRFIRTKESPEILISGPKGVGKTLLLKLKRTSMVNHGVKLLPKNQLVDKFIGTPYFFSVKKSEDLFKDENYWKSIWLMSLITIFLKVEKDFDEKTFREDVKSVFIKEIVASRSILSACDAFARFLTMSRQQYFEAYDDLSGSLIPFFRQIHSPAATFIDNVDEYFNLTVNSEDNESVARDFKFTLWINAQKGLAKAARELNSLNNHVKVFATIRQEVMQIFGANDPMALQISGSTLELEYSYDDLKEMLIKNIQAEDRDNLVSPECEDFLESFFGKNNLEIEHRYTNEDENVVDFILRHTLMRPRDVSLLGGKISEIPPSRRNAEIIRDTVNSASKNLIQSYLTSAQVTISNINEEVLLRMFSTNILQREHLSVISEKYDQTMSVIDGRVVERHVFCELYRLGLLGFVDDSNKSEGRIQRFARVGTIPAHPEKCLPNASTYLLHPALYDLIATYNPTFFNGMDSLNIIGHLRSWREHEDIHFVVKADVAKYSEIMLNADLNEGFPASFDQIVRSNAKNLLYAEVSEGDSLLLVDRNWKNVVLAFNDINNELKNSIYGKQLRAGGDAGIIRYDYSSKNKLTNLRGGSLRNAGRIEPIGNPGQLVVTEQFFKIAKKRSENAKFYKLTPDELPKARPVGGQFDLSKNAEDPTLIQSLYRVDYVK